MPRVQQTLLIGATILASWLGMQAVHELGHVLAALFTGGKVDNVALHPLGISRTDVSESRHSLLVAWGGPFVGGLLPLVAWWLVDRSKVSIAPLLRFFAGFCLIANGAYIGLGSFESVGDCGDLLRHGAALWQLWLFGGVTIPVGFWLWNGLGASFGLGKAAKGSGWQLPLWAVGLALALIGWGLWVGD